MFRTRTKSKLEMARRHAHKASEALKKQSKAVALNTFVVLQNQSKHALKAGRRTISRKPFVSLFSAFFVGALFSRLLKHH